MLSLYCPLSSLMTSSGSWPQVGELLCEPCFLCAPGPVTSQRLGSVLAATQAYVSPADCDGVGGYFWLLDRVCLFPVLSAALHEALVQCRHAPTSC